MKSLKIGLAAALVFAGVAAAQADTKDAWLTTKAKIALLTTDGVSATAVNVDTASTAVDGPGRGFGGTGLGAGAVGLGAVTERFSPPQASRHESAARKPSAITGRIELSLLYKWRRGSG
jgi:hypothetical protein